MCMGGSSDFLPLWHSFEVMERIEDKVRMRFRGVRDVCVRETTKRIVVGSGCLASQASVDLSLAGLGTGPNHKA